MSGLGDRTEGPGNDRNSSSKVLVLVFVSFVLFLVLMSSVLVLCLLFSTPVQGLGHPKYTVICPVSSQHFNNSQSFNCCLVELYMQHFQICPRNMILPLYDPMKMESDTVIRLALLCFLYSHFVLFFLVSYHRPN